MSSPTKAELPKPLTGDLASELTREHQLRPTETTEKVVLPTKEDVDKERQEKSLLSEIASGIKLKETETQEKVVLPTAAEILAEKRSD